MATNDNMSRFADVVRGLCTDGRSGTLYVRTGDNHAAMLLLEAGHIIGAYFGGLKGRKAIAQLRMSDGLTTRFQEGRAPPVRHDLLSTTETLAELIGEPGDTPAPNLITEPATKAQPPTDGQSVHLGLGNIIVRILVREYAKYIGPAAHGVVGDAQRNSLNVVSHQEMAATIDRLSAELLEPDEQKAFARDVVPEIDRLFTKAGIDTIAEQLVESLGPVARSVLDRALVNFGGTIKDPAEMERLVATLVQEIDDPHEAQHFVARLRRALETLAS